MKPTDHIDKLISSLSAPENIKHEKNNKTIFVNRLTNVTCFILHKGSIGVYRGNDHFLITNIFAPMIIGLNFINTTNHDFYYRTRTDIDYEIISIHQAKKIIEDNDLWCSLAYLHMSIVSRFYDHQKMSSGLTTYELVCNKLIELTKEPADFRLNTIAGDYIKEKSLLSRSRILKILSDLKKGGYIEIEKGILLSVKYLPDKY